jgi:transcriptional regulator with XRE-family HTH domain
VNTIDEWLTRTGGLATRLHELRKSAGFTGATMAAALNWTQSKISKIENGRQMPTSDDVTTWVRHCHADESILLELLDLLAETQALHQEWKQQIRLGQAAIQRNYEDLAQQATVIRNAELTIIPGLLQTPEYAAERMAENVRLHQGDPQEIAAATAVRMRRQQILYDPSKRFEFVITEAALRLLLSPPAAMLAQLDRLLSLTAGMPNIWFGIIPFGVQIPTAPQNRFILFDDLAVVETHLGETMHHGEEAATYATAMDALKAEAHSGEPARHLILQAAADLRRTNAQPTSRDPN